MSSGLISHDRRPQILSDELMHDPQLPQAPLGLFARPEFRWGFTVGAVGLVLRIGFWLSYAPVSYGDTPSYMRLATALKDAGLSRYDATRVPGYPAFLALLGRDPELIWIAQMALGWGISMLLFVFAWRAAGSPAFGALVGLLYNFIPGPVFFEANLLSETLTAFFLVMSLALLVGVDRAGSRRRAYGLALAMGISASLAALVRPLFFLLPVWLLIFVWFRPGGWNLRLALIYASAPVLLLGAWLTWVYTTYDMFAPTTLGGYQLVQHTGEYFEFLPDEVAPLRDVYLEYRDAQIAERGTQTNAIWDAIPEMTEVSGLSFFGLSAELQRLSLQLIVQHPKLYLANVAQGWVDFWKAPVFWDRDAVRSELIGGLFAAWVVVGRLFTLIANAAFLAGSVLVVVSRRVRGRLGLDRYILVTGGLVWLASIVQTLADHGDNPRFLIPLQMFVFYMVASWMWQWKGTRTA